MTHRALVVDAGNAGKAYAETHHNGIEVRSGQIWNLHPSLDARTLRARSLELAQSTLVVLGGLPRYDVRIEEARASFGALRRPADVLQVVFTCV